MRGGGGQPGREPPGAGAGAGARGGRRRSRAVAWLACLALVLGMAGVWAVAGVHRPGGAPAAEPAARMNEALSGPPAGGAREPAAAGAPVSAGPGPDVAMRGTRIVAREEGRRQWEMVAGAVEARGQASSQVITLRSIRRGVLYQDGKPAYFFSAQGAVYQPGTGDLRLLGPLRVWDGRGDWLQGKDASWDPRRRELQSGQPVELQLDGYRVRGRNWRLSQETEVLEIGGPVRLAGKGAHLVAEGLRYFPGNKRLEILGRTRIDLDVSADHPGGAAPVGKVE